MRTFKELAFALADVKSPQELADLRYEAGEALPLREYVQFNIAANLKTGTLQTDLLAKRVADLEKAFHDHVQTLPHALREGRD